MANLAAKVVSEYFNSRDLNHEVVGDDGECIRTGFTLEKSGNQSVLLIFDEDGTDVKLIEPEVGSKFPEEKKPAMYELCSKLNANYRWIKFYVSEDENVIRAEDDGVIHLDSCGEECERLLIQMVRIVDEAYGEIMKAIWS